MKKLMTLLLKTTLVLSFSISELRAQVAFNIRAVAQTGDPAPFPAQLSRAESPSFNDTGQVAYVGDGAVFLSSPGTQSIVVAGLGDPAPGDATILTARAPSLNAFGQIAFQARLSPVGAPGLYLSSEGGITKIAEDNDPAPGGGRLRLSFFDEPVINAAGQVVFSAFQQPGGAGLFLLSEGQTTPLVGAGDPVPGGGTFSGVRLPNLNDRGDVIFMGEFSLGGSGLFLLSQGNLTKIARIGDPAPNGGIFNFFRQIRPSINATGQVAFTASTTLLNDSGVYLFSGDQLTRLVQQGGPAPGGGTFLFLESPSLNAAGQVAFRASVQTDPFNFGVFLVSQGVVSQIVRPGSDSPEGDTFRSADTPTINAAGEIAFLGQVRNHEAGVYLFSSGAVARIAGPGDQVERVPRFVEINPLVVNGTGGVIFSASSFPGGWGFFDTDVNPILRAGDPAPGGGVFTVALNFATSDSGYVVFLGELSTGDHGIYRVFQGLVTQVARDGDPAPGGGTFLSLSDSAVNNLGQVAFTSALGPAGGSGLFFFSEVQVTQLLRNGTPAPGGGTFQFFVLPSTNDLGQIAFLASAGSPSRPGIFLWSEGQVRAVAQAGDAAPGGGTFQFNSFFGANRLKPSLNASGQIGFAAELAARTAGVYLYADGAMSRIAGPGDPTPDGSTISSASVASLNDAGQVAFEADLGRDGTGTYLFSEGAIVKVAKPGDPAPDTGTFAIADAPMLDSQGDVAFFGLPGPPFRTGFYLATLRQEQ